MKKAIKLTESQLNKIISESINVFLAEETVEDDGFSGDYWAIGFAEQYYTLWYVEKIQNRNSDGSISRVTRFNYLKNISKDKDIAFSKYPDAVFEPGLRGMRRSWQTQPQIIWDNVDTFRFGKYRGREIASVHDIDYTIWYYGQIDDKDHKAYVLKYLESEGYVEYEGKIMLKSVAERKENIYDEVMDVAKNGGTIDIFVRNNPANNGCILDEDREMFFYFKDVAARTYNGFDYYVPTINGKGKRVKNKTIRAKIEAVELDGWEYVGYKDGRTPPYFAKDYDRYLFVSNDEYDEYGRQGKGFDDLNDLMCKCEEVANRQVITIENGNWDEIYKYNKKQVGKLRFYITDFEILK